MKATNPKCVRENSTIDLTFTADEVSKCIAKLKNKKASSKDSISNEMIKTGSPTILPFLVTFLMLYEKQRATLRIGHVE